jgi:hypothetical protein
MSVLDCLYNAVSQILRKNVDKKSLFDNLEVSFCLISTGRKRYRYGYSTGVYTRDAPDIRPAGNPAFLDIRYPAGYRISLPDIR